MRAIVQINGFFLNLNTICLVEYSEAEYPIAIVHWTTGQKRIFRRNEAKGVFEALKRATLFDSTTT